MRFGFGGFLSVDFFTGDSLFYVFFEPTSSCAAGDPSFLGIIAANMQKFETFFPPSETTLTQERVSCPFRCN